MRMTDLDAAALAAAGAAAVRDLGFTLLDSDRPAAPGGSKLLVALRDHPTFRHFDPELVTCWVAAEGRGRPVTIDRRAPAGERTILWGHVHVVDRIGVENRFLTFGGSLGVTDVTPELRLVRHASPGPVVRWGGHSQGLDLLAGEIGAFFGRLILPVDYVPGAEARLAATPPAHLYAAFLHDRTTALRRTPGSVPLDELDEFPRWLRAEAVRLRRDDPGGWEAGSRLLGEIGLAAPRARGTATVEEES